MNCEAWRDLMPEFAIGALDADEASALRAHLASGCPACAGALAEAHATVALLAESLPPARPSPQLRQHLLDRATKTPQADAMGKSQASPLRRRANPAWAALAASVFMAAGAAMYFRASHRAGLRQLNDLRATLAERETKLEELQSLVASEQVRLLSLAASSPQTQGAGRVFWDRERGKWHLYVFDLLPPGPGKTYELWFITADGRKVPAGTFDVAADGSGSLTVPVPSDIGVISVAAITDEPAGGSPQPTGQIHLQGAVQ